MQRKICYPQHRKNISRSHVQFSCLYPDIPPCSLSIKITSYIQIHMAFRYPSQWHILLTKTFEKEDNQYNSVTQTTLVQYKQNNKTTQHRKLQRWETDEHHRPEQKLGWIQMLVNDKQLLIIIKPPPCY